MGTVEHLGPGRGPDFGGFGRHGAYSAIRDACSFSGRTAPARSCATRGEVLITLGMVVLLFVVYEVYWTDLVSAGKQQDATTALDSQWGAPTGDDPERQDHFQGLGEGDGFAKMYIPSFGADYHFTIVEGTTEKSLEIGPGHYTKSAYPGQPGNFAVAGHRVGKGAPFNDINLIQSCDAIVVETQYSWFVYRMLPQVEEKQGWARQQGQGRQVQGRHPARRSLRQARRPADRAAHQRRRDRAGPAERRRRAQQGRDGLADDADDLPPALLRQGAADRPRGAHQAVGEGPEEAQRAAAGARGDRLMYGWIWRHLPGPVAIRAMFALVLAAGFVALLMFVVFPWLEPFLPFNNVGVE